MTAPGPAVPVTPLTLDRLEAHLTGRGFHVARDSDGDLTGRWDSHRFWFFLVGDGGTILQIRGRGGRTLDTEHRAAVLLAINDWNRDRIWPKCYLREEEGRLACYTEVSVPLRVGVTEAQLGMLVDCGLGSGLRFFASLPEHLLDRLATETDGPEG